MIVLMKFVYFSQGLLDIVILIFTLYFVDLVYVIIYFDFIFII